MRNIIISQWNGDNLELFFIFKETQSCRWHVQPVENRRQYSETIQECSKRDCRRGSKEGPVVILIILRQDSTVIRVSILLMIQKKQLRNMIKIFNTVLIWSSLMIKHYDLKVRRHWDDRNWIGATITAELFLTYPDKWDLYIDLYVSWG